MSEKLMDTAPGGESTQYESIQTVTNPTDTQSGQLEDKNTSEGSANSELDQQKQEREKVAENVRYGQNISESGVGGKTTDSDGTGNQGGFGGTSAQEGEGKASQTREEQGYGPGSGVGA